MGTRKTVAVGTALSFSVGIICAILNKIYAREVFEAIELAKEQGKGAISLRGKMVDAPIVERARQVLEAAEAIHGGAKK